LMLNLNLPFSQHVFTGPDIIKVHSSKSGESSNSIPCNGLLQYNQLFTHALLI
jgi:hypothetical protein